jgi:hypothetical protein
MVTRRSADAGSRLDDRFAFTSSIPKWLAHTGALALVLVVVATGLIYDAPFAGGADAYGYVSQAEHWANGTLHVREPLALELTGGLRVGALSPLGYRPSVDWTSMVPIFPPGYPMQMAVLQRIWGRSAVFYAVPLLGGLAVWATYLMGVRLAGPTAGLAAAVLLATSPTFLIQLMFPMSDVPVTAWWAVTLALLLSDFPGATGAAGLAAAIAVLTRPNTAPLALVPGLWLSWSAVRERSFAGLATRRAIAYAAGVAPGFAAILAVNHSFYGSATEFGQGLAAAQFDWHWAWPNLVRYPRWLVETQTPVVFVACAAPFLVGRRGADGTSRTDARSVASMWLAFTAVVYLAYLFYFPKNEWFWLRYLLPAFPALFALTGTAIVLLLLRVGRVARRILVTIIVGGLAWHGVAYSRKAAVFDHRTGDSRAAVLGCYVRARLPERAVFLSMHYSGAIRYYAGRPTLRFDDIARDGLDDAMTELRRLGYKVYFALDQPEEQTFHDRFAPDSEFGRLDWSPKVAVTGPIASMIYDPDDRQTFLGSTSTQETVGVEAPGFRCGPRLVTDDR